MQLREITAEVCSRLWESREIEIKEPLDDRLPRKHFEFSPSQSLPISGKILAQELFTFFLCHHATTQFYLPVGLPDSYFDDLYLYVQPIGEDEKNRLFYFSAPDVFRLLGFFETLRKELVHPLFTESCKTYAALGRPPSQCRYWFVEDADPLPADSDDPLIRFIEKLPSKTPVDLCVYLPVEKAVENKTLRQVLSLCGDTVFVTGVCGGKECVTSVISERK